MAQRTDLGMARAIDIRADGQGDDQYRLIVTPATGDKVTLQANREALRGLWSHLTKILYPRAASQLTKRIGTVKAAHSKSDPDVTHRIVAYADESHPGLITISGYTKTIYWTAQIDHDAGGSLWTSLEDKLNEV
jgi:hypothetical protein